MASGGRMGGGGIGGGMIPGYGGGPSTALERSQYGALSAPAQGMVRGAAEGPGGPAAGREMLGAWNTYGSLNPEQQGAVNARSVGPGGQEAATLMNERFGMFNTLSPEAQARITAASAGGNEAGGVAALNREMMGGQQAGPIFGREGMAQQSMGRPMGRLGGGGKG